ncbi:MAG: VWA domain-containing protein [Gammaproteobacteria bacterium]|nr:VWA domain-containing protein [Gammaproteobacteria bacterium]
MRRRQRRNTEVFSLSFLDCICCGFGAIILLLVLNEVGQPIQLEQARVDLDGQVAKLEQELEEIRGESLTLERDLRSRVEQLSEEQRRNARLAGELSQLQGKYRASRDEAETVNKVEGTLAEARQQLTEEMKRLLGADYRRSADQPVGGIPVDSEYVIFIVDTSGSMQSFSWRRAERKMAEVLAIYPKVKGIQVLDDEGGYMFSDYRGKWIPDSPARRKAILARFRGWQSFSNSSPVEGIVAAIRTFWSPEHKISLYVLGDEFTGASIEDVVGAVERINRPDRGGQQRVRIHAIGFPLAPNVPQYTSIRFATLMRILCLRNGGTFVGLTGESYDNPGRRPAP